MVSQPYVAAAKSLQSCPTLCDPINDSPPGSLSLGFSRQEHWSGWPISLSSTWKWKVKVKLLSHVWLCDPIDCSVPGSSIHGIFQARVLEWVAISFSTICNYWRKLSWFRGSSLPHFGWVLHLLSHQGSPGILDCGYPFPSPGNLPNPGIEPGSSALQLDSLPDELPGKLQVG